MPPALIKVIPLLLAALGVFMTLWLDNEPGVLLFGLRAEFLLFALTLAGVALLHASALYAALTGLALVTLLKLGFTDFALPEHLLHELPTLINLFGLLVGFELLAKHFEASHLPEALPHYLPDSWWGGFWLLVITAILSTFLDNIAAAMIGGTLAMVLFNHRVHIGYLAAIVAASNAGGAGSVLGDTTTTMMWIDGVSPWDVTHAFIGSVVAVAFVGFFAARQQHRYQPIMKDNPKNLQIDWMRIVVVAGILAGTIIANLWLDFPAAGVWAALLLGIPLRKPDWSAVAPATKGSVFLISLVLCASMMPVETLPTPSWQTTFGMGFVSAVFDNIPLTKLALDQGGYDWGVLAFAVGYGGSMIWFGSSAGVALSNLFPEAKSVEAWIKHGWHVAVAYVLGFFAIVWLAGWAPHAPHKTISAPPTATHTQP
jgi:Na+/H+ antiporter NhaD/arsenite permease-like protein